MIAFEVFGKAMDRALIEPGIFTEVAGLFIPAGRKRSQTTGADRPILVVGALFV